MWKPDNIGTVIAERALEFKSSDGIKNVFLRLGQPVRSPSAEEGDPWYCPIVIEGLGITRFKVIAGEDSLQSLLLALQLSKKILPKYAKEEGGSIYWLAEEMDSIFDQQNMIDVYSMMTGEAFQMLRDVATKIQETKSKEMIDALTQIELLLEKYRTNKKQ
jgi:hypothetical protein